MGKFFKEAQLSTADLSAIRQEFRQAAQGMAARQNPQDG
mgnify:CR=1 FL=1